MSNIAMRVVWGCCKNYRGQLTAIPSHQEIHDTLKSMENRSALGPEDYMPIGLCNTSYKIISKLIVQRLKPLMEKIISPYQATYVSGRLISDNTVIAQEIIHSMKKKRGQIGWMALKLDMSKAFDRLEWDFLIKVLRHLSNAQHNNSIKGIKVDASSPAINHLLFANDCFIFTQATVTSANNLLDLLHNFNTQSGQVINFDKSSIRFSKKTNPELVDTITQLMGVKHMSSKEKYLGSPLLLGHSKQEDFKSIEDNFLSSYSSWSSTSLTQAGRSTMIKHVLNSVPIYQMGTYKLRSQLINKLTTIQRRFFWGHNSNRGSNPLGWHKVCIPKELGGLAFRDLEKLNLALLTKLAWRLYNENDSLWTNIMRSKYFKNGDILHQELKAGNGSYTWNGIVKGIQVVKQNYFTEVDNGKKTKIWLDRWIPGMIFPPVPINDLFRFYQNVEELILPETNIWNDDLLHKLFDNNTVQKILSIILDTSKEDTMLWMPARDGKFSVKSTYKHLTLTTSVVQVNGRNIENKIWGLLWKTNTAHRIKLFSWKCIRDLHNTRYKLSTYNENIAPHCVICGGGEETIEHLFFECDYAKKIWRLLSVNIDTVHSTHHYVSECDAIFQGVSLNSVSSIHKITYHMHSHFHEPLSNNITLNISMISQWKPPLHNILKLNVDASFCHTTKTLGTGVVLRTGTGSCEGVKGSFSNGVLSPEARECMAIREALTWANDRRLLKIHIEAYA
ncbi:uncharacterized protein LOC113360875 [Papaver somniferum]|uniref:uncharacterized protein LOC113360875 n=1 Tax=Papaver somniferum TaxID=3469 RepID=UPI000E6F784A|nr:uncharacterized protein LOC113360875 [Papaver somniferum]